MSVPGTCPKCGQPGWGPMEKWVTNRKGRQYHYEVFVHHKWGKHTPHYIRRIDREGEAAEELDKLKQDRTEKLTRLNQDLTMDHEGNLFYKGVKASKSKKGIVAIVEDLLGGEPFQGIASKPQLPVELEPEPDLKSKEPYKSQDIIAHEREFARRFLDAT